MTAALTIRSIRARGIDLALQRPVETASGVMRTAPLVLIDLLTEEGITGCSYVRCYTPVALDPLVMLIANLEPLLRGEAAAPAPVERKLQRHFRLLGPQGLTGIAMAGIDMALWDARAKACEVPLVTLLGGEPKPIPAYASLRTMSPAGAAAEAEGLVARGFTAIKVKIGRADLAADLDTIRAVRGAIGSDAKLMVDYNQSLSVPDAIDRARALDDEGLYWIEEPTRADDFEGHARIAAAAKTRDPARRELVGPQRHGEEHRRARIGSRDARRDEARRRQRLAAGCCPRRRGGIAGVEPYVSGIQRAPARRHADVPVPRVPRSRRPDPRRTGAGRERPRAHPGSSWQRRGMERGRGAARAQRVSAARTAGGRALRGLR